MAKDKKSFVLYADLLTSVDHLTDEELGKLFRHTLQYVNDLNPVIEDRLLLTAWKPIERSLKEDLKKWEEIRTKRAKAGAKGGKAKQANAKSVKQNVANQAVSVTDSVSVSVNVDKQVIFNKWLSYRKEIGKPIKVKSTLTNLINKFNSEPLDKVEYVVNASIENGWQGLFWDKYVEKPINNGLQKPQKLKDLYD